MFVITKQNLERFKSSTSFAFLKFHVFLSHAFSAFEFVSALNALAAVDSIVNAGIQLDVFVFHYFHR